MNNYLVINQNSIENLKTLRTFCQGARSASPKDCSHAFSFIEQALNEMIAEQVAIIDEHIRTKEHE